MYFIVDFEFVSRPFRTFMEAFRLQQKNRPFSHIVFRQGRKEELVWNPIWEFIDMEN
jgi:hypothetical protein